MRFNCERLASGGGAELWGRSTKQGLLGVLQGGPPGATLVLEDVHLVGESVCLQWCDLCAASCDLSADMHGDV